MNSQQTEFPNYPPGGILAFYTGQHPDSSGRTIEQIWMWDNRQLDRTHDYIQWLFPLLEKSRFNTFAPTLDEEVIQEFRTHKNLRKRLLRSLKVMLKFYGLQGQVYEDKTIQITKSAEYLERKKDWISPSNHNYLRLTRILTSLTLLGLKPYAQALFTCLKHIYQEEERRIGEVTYSYWKNAILTKV